MKSPTSLLLVLLTGFANAKSIETSAELEVHRHVKFKLVLLIDPFSYQTLLPVVVQSGAQLTISPPRPRFSGFLTTQLESVAMPELVASSLTRGASAVRRTRPVYGLPFAMT